MRGGRVLSASILWLLAACDAFRGAPPSVVDATGEVEALNQLHSGSEIARCIGMASAEQLSCRDRIVQARLIAIDARYTEFRQRFYREARSGDFAATVVSLGLTGAASVGGVSRVAGQALSAAATAVTGTKAAFDKDILVDRAASAIENSMDAARNTVAVRIRTGLGSPVTAYPLAVALSDLEDYYNAGTLLGAFDNIGSLAGAQAKEAEQELKTLASVRSALVSHSTSTQTIQAWINPGGTFDPARRNRLSRWLADDQVDRQLNNIPWQQFLTDPVGQDFEADRQRAIRELDIR